MIPTVSTATASEESGARGGSALPATLGRGSDCFGTAIVSGWSSSAWANGKRSPLRSASAKISVCLSKYGSGAREPHGAPTVERKCRSERNHNHAPSGLQNCAYESYRSLVTGVVLPERASYR